MSDKSNKYGYVGVDIPAQSFGANKGVLNPAEINELVADNKWTSFGQLELIETQTVSGVNAVDFLTLGNYNVHFLTINNYQVTVNNSRLVVRLYENGVLESASVYQWAFFQALIGSGIDFYTTSNTAFPIGLEQPINFGAGGYTYFYNLTDSSKYSFMTNQHIRTSDTMIAELGSGVLPQASAVDGIRVLTEATSPVQNFSLTASLYGIRYS